MVVLAIFQNPDQANLLRSHLAGMGIRAEIGGEYIASTMPFLSAPGGGVQILVEPEEFSRAMAALKSLELLEFSPWVGIDCPKCGSPKVEWTRNYGKDVPWFLFIGGLLLLGIPLLLRRKCLHCLDCGALWRG